MTTKDAGKKNTQTQREISHQIKDWANGIVKNNPVRRQAFRRQKDRIRSQLAVLALAGLDPDERTVLRIEKTLKITL